ncbi:glutamate-5-semialdehyde dehydrogenase [Polytolypa hystricis UAMH7299]|uniref:glutamate-5-semialdehyde dehydrogenase n=1 Tax=Polytolypa hystricis (strain UAMH7299) TaxID=1447883 RepID=A0A2B7YK85_POLH7|nr:glutamate-5-semialdehyde dehydrogenase [Polytolypa hystricis UAMH7299]
MSLTDSSPAEAARLASIASRQLATLSTPARSDALDALHSALVKQKDFILEANARDVRAATIAAENGDLSRSILKRLDLRTPGKYEDMLQGIIDVRDLEDPIGKISMRTLIDDGGKESTESFVAISNVISEAIAATQVPNAAIQLVRTRDAILPLLAQDQYIDLVIPRGSNDLVRHVKSNTKIPVLGHADGICSIYLHSDAEADMAAKVITDAKTNYPAACNAVETLLVDQDALSTLLPSVAESLISRGVVLRCDAASKEELQKSFSPAQSALLQDATEDDYRKEFLDLILAIKTIIPTSEQSSLDLAIDHINTHSSGHTDVILTSSRQTAEQFLSGVDSAGVYWNASTRFADGMRYGFGTEVGISTNKIHSRGPVGLEGLTIYKYLIRGGGHAAGDYFQGEGGKKWKHQKLEI